MQEFQVPSFNNNTLQGHQGDLVNIRFVVNNKYPPCLPSFDDFLLRLFYEGKQIIILAGRNHY
jgi:hypothetical protein